MWTCYSIVLLVALVATTITTTCLSFTQPPSSIVRTSRQHSIGNVFGGLFGQEPVSNTPKTVIDLPATHVKIGPLKFFLQIYLVAEQNKPVKGAWVLNSNEEKGSLDMYYKDGTGMFSIDIQETSIQINRNGQRPSLEYMLQESLLLHGLLGELNQIALEVDDIAKEKRLLQLVDDNSIIKAQATLPARKEG